jgi:hypothetical protein
MSVLEVVRQVRRHLEGIRSSNCVADTSIAGA